jgi:hypothetical protein
MKTVECLNLSQPPFPVATEAPSMKLSTCANLVHTILFDMRRRLEQAGSSGSTILAAEATLAHLLPMLLGGSWKGTCQMLSDQCGRSPVSIRRSLRVLERAGVLRSKALGRHGVELHFLLPHRDEA